MNEKPKVRLAFIWASESIGTNTPAIYEEHMPVFEKLLRDPADKVRMEAPEIFRALGKPRRSSSGRLLRSCGRWQRTTGTVS